MHSGRFRLKLFIITRSGGNMGLDLTSVSRVPVRPNAGGNGYICKDRAGNIVDLS